LQPRTQARGWIAALYALHLALGAWIPLGDAEAYYWLWSRDLEWSYFDHPPLIAWLLRASGLVFGDGAFAVRFVPATLAALTAWVLMKVVALAGGDGYAERRVVLLHALTPMFFVAGFAASPDAPVLLAAAVVTWAVAKAIRDPDDRWAPAWAGIAIGAGLLAKLSMSILALSVLGLALARRDLRRRLREAPFWIGLAAAIALASPVLYWNAGHDWATWSYHAARPGGFSWLNFGRWVGGQIGYYSPLIAGGVLARIFSRGAGDPFGLSHLAWPSFVFNSYLILRTSNAEPQWTALAYVPGIVLLALAIPRWSARWPRLYTAAAGLTAAVFGIALTGAAIHLGTDWIVRAIPADRYRPRVDLANDMVGWPRVAEEVSRFAAAQPAGRPLYTAAAHYTLCGQLAFATRDRPKVVCPSPRRDAFDLIPGRSAPPPGADLLFLSDDRFTAPPSWPAPCEPPRWIEATKGGRVVRRFALTLCRG
jgi:4-amino-4-deoxy-L-arabinose transferase-like glycosyltransferase